MPRKTPTSVAVRERARDQFQDFMPAIRSLLPSVIPPAKFATIAIGALNRKELLPCLEQNPGSVFGAILQCAQLGLMPSGLLGEAYILPFGGVATLIPGYKGYLKLMWRSGKIRDIHVDLVKEKDQFEYRYDLQEGGHVLRHERYDVGSAGSPGEVTGGYSVIHLDGEGTLCLYVPRAKIDQARASSKQSQGQAWTTYFDEMAMKSIIRRWPRVAPLSTELETATGLDDQVEAGDPADLTELAMEHGFEAGEVEVDASGPKKLKAIKAKLKKVAGDDDEEPEDDGPQEVFKPDAKQTATPTQLKRIQEAPQTGECSQEAMNGYLEAHGIMGRKTPMNQVEAHHLIQAIDTGSIEQFVKDGVPNR